MFSAATKTGSQPAAVAANYVEDVFSTYLYTGTGLNVNNTITNGIDLAAEGGLVWTKARSVGYNNALNDTARGFSNYLSSNSTGAQNFAGSLVTMTANSNGYTVNDTNGSWNESGQNFVSWTFRKQPKFFDVVTYTGDGVAGRTVSHSLGSTPGMIIVKCTSASYSWFVYHRSVNGGTNPQNYYMLLNSTAAQDPASVVWNDTAPTSTEFTVGTAAGTNANGQTYVAYLFAHDAGGFGTSGTDNVISCGSFTTDSSGDFSVNLGYEPQWLLVKAASGSYPTDSWYLQDIMRSFSQTNSKILNPNNSSAESSQNTWIKPNATGFSTNSTGAFSPTTTYIYMAIRRPMKVPTDATTVFSPVAYTGNGAAGQTLTGQSLPPDLSIFQYRSGVGGGAVGQFDDRLRGGSAYLAPSSTNAEGNTSGYYIRSFNMDGVTYGTSYVDYNYNGNNYVNWLFTRRPGFFDEVCYTGSGSPDTITHNLGVAPQLIIARSRSPGSDWAVYSSTLGNNGYLFLQSNAASSSFSGAWGTGPTATTFKIDSSNFGVTGSCVAYLFATCPGVSKVGSYTGNGGTQAISCGFTGGARFVLIKRTDASGDWYVYDTARGMTTLVDPYLLLNSTAAESATLGSVTTTAGGFTVNASILAAINTSGASYIFLAIA